MESKCPLWVFPSPGLWTNSTRSFKALRDCVQEMQSRLSVFLSCLQFPAIAPFRSVQPFVEVLDLLDCFLAQLFISVL